MNDINSEEGFDEHLNQSDIINHRLKLWLTIWLLIAALCLALVAVVSLAVTKRVETVPVLVNEITGQVSQVTTDITDLKMSTIEALDHSYINTYVIASERFTDTQIEEDYRTVDRFTCSRGVSDTFYKNVDLADPNNYFDRYPGGSVQPEIESINFFKKAGDVKPENKNISEDIRYYTVIFSRTISGPALETKKPRYSLIIGVDYTEKAESAITKRLNPFGFCVYSYQKTVITVKDSR